MDSSRRTQAAMGKMHVQEISATDSTVSEHDLTELVGPPVQLSRYHGQPAPAMRAVSSPAQHGYGYPEGQASRVQQYLSEQNAYQNRSLPSPPVSSGSAPTVLQSFPSWDPTWRSGGVSEDGRGYTYHVPHSIAGTKGISPATRSSPRWNQEGTGAWDEEGANNVVEPYLGGWEAEYSEEDQKRLTQGEYRLGVGYDVSVPNTSGKPDKAITEARRAERLKALQREFGAGDASRQDGADEKGGETKKQRKPKLTEKESFKAMRAREKEEQARINLKLGVGKDGKLISSGPKQRTAMRWLQGVLALVAICGGIGGALLIHPDDDEEPAPSGALSTWAMYILSVISLLVTFWTFIIRRCYRRKKSIDESSGGHALNPAGMVLPVFSHGAYGPVPGGKAGKKQKGGWFKPAGAKGRPGHPGQPMTVNLVLDPATIARFASGGSHAPSRYDDVDDPDAPSKKRQKRKGERDDLEDGDSSDTAFDPDDGNSEDDADFAIPDSSKRRASKPLGVIDAMAAMRLQDRWRAARKSMKRQAAQDAVLCVLWLGLSTWLIGFGNRCPPGSSAGWCDLYNTALASGVLLCICFGTSFVFCYLDLRRSRSVPRLTRA